VEEGVALGRRKALVGGGAREELWRVRRLQRWENPRNIGKGTNGYWERATLLKRYWVKRTRDKSRDIG
jgi:hypothetical protein